MPKKKTPKPKSPAKPLVTVYVRGKNNPLPITRPSH